MEKENLKIFLDDSILDRGNIVFSKVIDIPNYQFIRNLLEEIMEYYKYLNDNIERKQFSSKNWETDQEEIKEIYYKELKRVQSLSYVREKSCNK